LIVDARPS